MFFFKELSIPKYSFLKKREFLNVLFKGKSIYRWPLFICFHAKENLELVCLLCFVKKNMSKYSLLSVFITKVAVVAIFTASISAAHPGSPPPDCTASGQGFATGPLARPLARYPRLHAFWSTFLRDANPDCRQRRQPVRQTRRPSACAARLHQPVRPAI